MKLSSIVGQQSVVERLHRAIERDRLAHGYLFVGADGTGREAVARGLAARVLCEQPAGMDACEQCSSCRRMQAGSHADLQVLLTEAESVRRALAEPEGGRNPSPEIRIEAVRELCRRLRMHAYEGRARVGIVVGAHRLRVEAANALLKTLEEPAPGTLLILIAPGPRAVLDTLRSRCQVVRYSPLSVETLAEELARRGGGDAVALRRVAERAEGSLQRALELHAEDLSQRHDQCRAFLDAAALPDAALVQDLVGTMTRDRDAALEHLAELARVLHDAMVRASHQGILDSIDRLGRSHAEVLVTERAVRGNAMAALALEALAVRLLPLLNGTDLGGLEAPERGAHV
ncbi:MAG: DNA polymerase III subunit delta' [Pseudomonadota bacterium]